MLDGRQWPNCQHSVLQLPLSSPMSQRRGCQADSLKSLAHVWLGSPASGMKKILADCHVRSTRIQAMLFLKILFMCPMSTSRLSCRKAGRIPSAFEALKGLKLLMAYQGLRRNYMGSQIPSCPPGCQCPIRSCIRLHIQMKIRKVNFQQYSQAIFLRSCILPSRQLNIFQLNLRNFREDAIQSSHIRVFFDFLAVVPSSSLSFGVNAGFVLPLDLLVKDPVFRSTSIPSPIKGSLNFPVQVLELFCPPRGPSGIPRFGDRTAPLK